MGSFVTNLHVRGADLDAVRAAVATLPGAMVTPPAAGWITISAGMHLLDESTMVHTAQRVAALGDVAIGFALHDSDIFAYWLVTADGQVDTYNSWPGYFEGAAPRPVGGDPDRLLPWCRPGVTPAKIRAVLGSRPTFADDILYAVAGFLGIPEERAGGEDEGAPVPAPGPSGSPRGQVLAFDPSRRGRAGRPQLAVLPGGATPLLSALLARDVDAVRDALAHTDDVDHATAGLTTLHVAVTAGEPDLVALLLEAGADPTLTVLGRTALELAREQLEATAQGRGRPGVSESGLRACVRLLEAAAAD